MATKSFAADQQATTSPDSAQAESGHSDMGSAADKVSEAIIRGIRAGTFVPGQHLVEPDLTRRLGISRGSLREALKHLAAEGIVTLNRFRGAYIASLDRKAILDLLQTLEPLCSLAARLAAEHCDSEDRKRQILQAAAEIDDANRAKNRGLYLERRRHFYSVMVQIGGNRELERAMPLTRTDLFRAQIEPVQSDKQRSRHASGYSKIAKAIVERNPAAAVRAVARHFAGTRQTIEEIPLDTLHTTVL